MLRAAASVFPSRSARIVVKPHDSTEAAVLTVLL